MTSGSRSWYEACVGGAWLVAATGSPMGLWLLWKGHVLAQAITVLSDVAVLRSQTLPHSVTRGKFLFSLRQLLHLRNFWYVLA